MKNKDLKVWWNDETGGVAASVFALADVLAAEQQDRVEDLRYHVSLYDGVAYDGMDFDNYWQTSKPVNTAEANIKNMTYNAIKSIIDTLGSRITKHKPRPVFLTDGGTWSEQRKAKKLTKFVEGQFNSLGIYESTRQAFRDACVFGTGILKLQRAGKKLEVMRVLPHQLLVPNEESHLGDPRQVHHRFMLHAEVLAGLFPRKRSAILEATNKGSTSSQTAQTSNAGAGMVDVIESWHLPSDEDSGDGRRTICIRGQCLLDEELKTNRFPFAVLHFDVPMMGFWGRGLVESSKELQAHLNEMVVLRAEIIRKTAFPAFLIKKSANLNLNDIADNEIGKFIKVAATDDIKPITMGVMPPEIVSQIDELFNRLYKLAGVSELSAQSKKPSGLDSAVAIREFDDIESDRFAVIQQQYEELALDIARHLIRLAKEAKDEGIDIETKRSGKKFFESIKWSDVDLDDSKYEMTLFSTSQLPRTPAARIQTLQEMFQMQLIDRAEFLKQLDVQDLEQFKDLHNAKVDDIFETVEMFLEGKPYEAPEKFQALEKGIEIFQLTYLQNRHHAPEMVLEKLRTWIDDAGVILDEQAKAQAAAQASQVGAPGAPMAPPGGAPQVLPASQAA